MKKQGKKILIGCLTSILIGGVIFIFVLSKLSADNYISTEENSKEIATEENVLDESIAEEILEENIETLELSETTEDETIVEDKEESSEKSTVEISNERTTSNNNQSNIKSSVQENKQTVTTTPVVSQKEEKPKETTSVPTQPVQQPKEEPKKDEHTYKYNAAVVEQIKNDIRNNESDFMKEYGYNIVVDESIVTQTNQFTYTGNRVKNMIIYKFGTIRIYARDYYLNGNYMYTESYIL